MMTRTHILTVLFVALLVVGICGAVPSNGAATLVSSNNFTLSATGAVGDTWVRWGDASGKYLTYASSNTTPDAGAVSVDIRGNMQAATEYDWTFCDSTGCDPVAHSVTTGALVPNPVSTLSMHLDELRDSNFDVLVLGQVVIEPALWLFVPTERDMGITILSFLVFFAIYAGMWLRTRGVATAAIAGIVLAPILLYSDSGLKLGLPPEVQAIAQALFYASLAGLALSVLKK